MVPSKATVAKVDVVTYEKREGMRRVRVELDATDPTGAPTRIALAEWVPVVLMGRLTVGSTVDLINDPTEGRTTFSL